MFICFWSWLLEIDIIQLKLHAWEKVEQSLAAMVPGSLRVHQRNYCRNALHRAQVQSSNGADEQQDVRLHVRLAVLELNM